MGTISASSSRLWTYWILFMNFTLQKTTKQQQHNHSYSRFITDVAVIHSVGLCVLPDKGPGYSQDSAYEPGGMSDDQRLQVLPQSGETTQSPFSYTAYQSICWSIFSIVSPFPTFCQSFDNISWASWSQASYSEEWLRSCRWSGNLRPQASPDCSPHTCLKRYSIMAGLWDNRSTDTWTRTGNKKKTKTRHGYFWPRPVTFQLWQLLLF